MASACKADSHDLRIVLLGVSGAGKSPTANAILGREAFRESRTRESEIQRGRVEDRNISIIDTPGFFNTQLTDEEQQNERMKSLYLCYPGPHVFLLVINLETFANDESNIVEEIQKTFGTQAFQFTIILFTGRETMANRKWKLFMDSRKFHELVSHCRGQYHAINSKNNIIPTHIKKLLEKIDDVIKQNDGQHYDISLYLRIPIKSRKGEIKQEKETKKQVKKVCETIHMHSVKEKCTTSVTERKDFMSHVTKMEKTEVYEDRCSAVPQENMSDVFKQPVKSLRRTVQKSEETWKVTGTGTGKRDQEKKQTIPAVQNRHSTPGESTELRMVMVGKTGVGKSATGNTILGQKVFKDQMCSESVTKECQQHQQTIDGRNISVIDTPGLFDTSISQQQLKEELVRCVHMSVPGPHVFLLVIRLDVRFTDEEKNTVKWIQENFGEEAARYTIILFTRGDQLKTSIDEFMNQNAQIRELVEQGNGGYHVFNNAEEEIRSQVSELLEKIDRMVKNNGGEHYTNEIFQDAQRQIWEEEKRLREEEERKKLEEEEKIREDERNRLLSKAKGVALVSAGVAVGAGATVVGSGVTFGPSVMSGMVVAGGAALASVANGATLSEALLAAGNAALTSVVNGESLPAALTGARAKKSSYH